MDRAIGYVKTYEISTQRGLALMFDTCIQQGSINALSKVKLTYKTFIVSNQLEKMKIIAQVMSEQTKPRWKEDVFSRRMAIINGKGKVHGEWVDVDKKFGIDDFAIDF